jgi:hypothetical protein
MIIGRPRPSSDPHDPERPYPNAHNGHIATLPEPWDLHYDNIFAGQREPWLAIDPEPLAGDPGFDLLPALVNRWDDIQATGEIPRKVRRCFDLLTEILDLEIPRFRGVAGAGWLRLNGSCWLVCLAGVPAGRGVVKYPVEAISTNRIADTELPDGRGSGRSIGQEVGLLPRQVDEQTPGQVGRDIGRGEPTQRLELSPRGRHLRRDQLVQLCQPLQTLGQPSS